MKKVLALMLSCATVLALGCGGGIKKPADLPKLEPTTVTVTYDDGEPVAEASVVFRLAQATGGRVWNVVGQTDSTGVAVMKTDGNWEGAPAGDYECMVTKQITEVEEPTEPGGSVTVKSVTQYVESRYGDPHDSGLKASVQAGQNSFEFKVGKKIEQDLKTL